MIQAISRVVNFEHNANWKNQYSRWKNSKHRNELKASTLGRGGPGMARGEGRRERAYAYRERREMRVENRISIGISEDDEGGCCGGGAAAGTREGEG